MRLILVGCEYAGKTTLAHEIIKWIDRTMGGAEGFHDHFTIPTNELPDEAREQYARSGPGIKEQFQRYMIQYHLKPTFYIAPDHLLVGFHIEEAVYAPLYYGYGRKGETSYRTALARDVEQEIMAVAPDTVLVLLKARADVIAKRMRENPHPRPMVQEADIQHVLERFEEEFEESLIRRTFELDTTSATVEETLAEFVAKIEPHLSDADRLRTLVHQQWR